MAGKTRPTCGRCGTYRHLHPTQFGCVKPRLSFWWDRHSLGRHIAGRLWLALSDSQRMSIVDRLHARRPNLCWCEFVDSALLEGKKGDYRGRWGCACDIPLPIGISEPTPGQCYCPTAEERAALDA